MKIVIADKITARGVDLLREAGWSVVSAPFDAGAPLAAELADADALVVRSATRVTAELLESAPRLRVIGRAGAGVDNIDLDAATRRGVLVMNTPGSNAVSVAELAFALLLSLARAVPQLHSSLQAGRWEKTAFPGTELRGKTLGLLGFGRVGMEMARRARAFEMRVVACDPFVGPEVGREEGVEMLSFDELLARSDWLSLHASLSTSTDRILNAAALAKMKRGARLINTARGELVDEEALAAALRSGHLAGAAIDVFTEEPPRNSPLLSLPNVIATPHMGAATEEAQGEVSYVIAEQIRDYLANGLLRNAVNLPNLPPEQYRRLRPYISLAERLGSMAGQVAHGRPRRVRIRYSGEPAELGTSILRNAVLAGLLNNVLDEKVNLVNAAPAAAARGLVVEEQTRRREHGFPDTLEVTINPARIEEGKPPVADGTLLIEGTVLYDTTPRILNIDGIQVECDLEGTILFTRNRDVPGVIGQMGQVLGNQGINIATFALGRRSADPGAEALALVRLDGDVPESIVDSIRSIAPVIEARLVRLTAK
jgi:D-3-phosphoglycerate dehydrogenase